MILVSSNSHQVNNEAWLTLFHKVQQGTGLRELRSHSIFTEVLGNK